MKVRLASIGLLVVAVTLLVAGCPQPADSGSGTTPWSGRIGGSSDGGAGGSVGPQVPASDTSTDAGGTDTTNTGDTGSEPAVVGGDTSGTTASPDALTVRFPECQLPAEAEFWRTEILRLVNQERQAQGLNPVTQNQTLEDQATEYACELIHYDFFGHVNEVTGSTLTDRAAESGYDYWIIGENLAAGQLSPAQVMADWMDSPCHRENLLNPAFIELGVGVRSGGDYGLYWVQEFGRPFSSKVYDGPPYSDPECVRTE
jgi:uncharacterized protein YkwD